MHLNKQVSLNLNVRGIGQSATIAINDRCREMVGRGETVYRLGLGQSPFPVPKVVVEALKHHAHEKDYLPAAGLRELRTAVADFHRRKHGIDFRPGNIMVGPGSKELMFILQLVYYGELIVPTPCWVSYAPQAKIVGRTVSYIHTRAEDKYRITAAALDKHCANQRDQYRPRILLLNYPGNPEGCSYNSDELKAIADVAREYQVVLLSDEIYGELHHRGEHVSVARYYPEGTIVSSGLSKWCGAGGWRLGTFAFPDDLDWLFDQMTAVASETFTSVSAPIQHAAITAFSHNVEIERYLQHVRRILSSLGNRCAGRLQSAGVRAPDPVGGFYLFLDFSPFAGSLAGRGITESVDLCERLLQDTGVAILPGDSFGRVATEMTARLAYVDFDGAQALAASETYPLDQPLPDDFVDNCCNRVIEATDLICDWLEQK